MLSLLQKRHISGVFQVRPTRLGGVVIIFPGSLGYISVPIGKEKIQFNAHRIFYASTVIENFNECQLLEFSTCDEKEIKRNTPINKYDENDNSGEIFGLFYFQKRKVARKFETNK